MQEITPRLWEILRKSIFLLEDGNSSSTPAPIGLRVPVPCGKACQIESSEMAQLLRDAGAPEPWLRPEKCTTIIGYPINLRESSFDAGDAKIGPEQKAQKAVNELRRVLPAVIEIAEKNINADLYYLTVLCETEQKSSAGLRLIDEYTREVEERLDDLKKLYSLRTSVESAPAIIKREPSDWHTAAYWLASYYKGVVGRIGISGDSPSVRFVQRALERLEWGTHETATIAKALRRL